MKSVKVYDSEAQDDRSRLRASSTVSPALLRPEIDTIKRHPFHQHYDQRQLRGLLEHRLSREAPLYIDAPSCFNGPKMNAPFHLVLHAVPLSAHQLVRFALTADTSTPHPRSAAIIEMQ